MDHTIGGDYMLFVLNTLGQAYNTSVGFEIEHPIKSDINDKNFIKFINDAFNQGYKIKNAQKYNYYEISEIPNYDPLYVDKRYLEKMSKLNINANSVIIQSNFNGKVNKHNEWYNKHQRKSLNLNNIDYINVEEPYSKIVLSSMKKFDSITIEDILFATRGMAIDGNRTLVDFRYNRRNKYSIISSSSDKLVIEPGMYNLLKI